MSQNEMHHYNIIGHQVKELRVERGWTQQTLVEKLNEAGLDVPLSALSQIELRLIRVNDFELFYMALVFKVSLNQLFPPIDPNDPDLHDKLMRHLSGRK